MSRSLNRLELIGHVGADPEIRTTSHGVKVATLSVATARQWTSASGEKQEKTEWHKCVVWGTAKSPALAGVVEQYVKKGDRLFLAGRVEYRQYEDKDKQTRYITEVNVSEVLLLGSKAMGRATEPQVRGESPREGFDDFPAAQDSDEDVPW